MGLLSVREECEHPKWLGGRRGDGTSIDLVGVLALLDSLHASRDSEGVAPVWNIR